jgi:hypothetical protein
METMHIVINRILVGGSYLRLLAEVHNVKGQGYALSDPQQH